MKPGICVHCFVSGVVQGVWYRASTKDQAKLLGVTGWVRNCDDGRVEALLCGAPEAVNKMQAWLHQGPPKAQVKEVICEAVQWQEHGGFEVR